MELLQVKNLFFKYNAQKDWLLKNINLTLREGEVILITGPTGCGKSTLIYCINGLIPRILPGVLSGEIKVLNRNINDMELNQISAKIGIVFQNPETQLFGLTVEEDVAFGPENLGLPRSQIKDRIKKAMKATNILNLQKNFVYTLSQGQKQRLAISGILALDPKILIFDEPTSDLDPKCTREVLNTIKNLSKNNKKAIILIEHKLDYILEIVDKILVMNNGEIIFNGKPEDLLIGKKVEKIRNLGIKIPNIIEANLEDLTRNINFNIKTLYSKPKNAFNNQKTLVSIKNLIFSYQKSKAILKDINLEIKQNEFIALLGENGSGKSTLAKCLNGLLKPTSGKVFIKNLDTSKTKIYKLSKIVGYLFQNPNHQIINTIVYQEIAFGLKNFKFKNSEINKKIDLVLDFFKLSDYKFKPIFKLSRGQRQLIALASILVLEPELLILDEPTTGQDFRNRLLILKIVEFLNKMGITIILITHDMELAYKFAKRVILLKDGRIIKDGNPQEIFNDKEFLEKIGLEQPNIIKSKN
ncbi:MAG: ABC transporter ATP-binding protein [Promethearchaeia archaeon]